MLLFVHNTLTKKVCRGKKGRNEYYIVAHVLLTQHDFISGDDDIEFEGAWNDLASSVAVVEIVLVNKTTTVCTTQQKHTEQQPW